MHDCNARNTINYMLFGDKTVSIANVKQNKDEYAVTLQRPYMSLNNPNIMHDMILVNYSKILMMFFYSEWNCIDSSLAIKPTIIGNVSN